MKEAHNEPAPQSFDEGIDVRDLSKRILAGHRQIIALTLLGAVVFGIAYWMFSFAAPQVTKVGVVFNFEGLQRSQYPDGSSFQPDDLRSAAVIHEALTNLGMKADDELQAKIRGAITVEGRIPPNIVKERERLRANGQTPPAYVPDQYEVALTLRRIFPLSGKQRELLLNEVLSAYRSRFQRTYADLPLSFGNAFSPLKDADFFEYELVLTEELVNIRQFLLQQQEVAKSYRSPATGLSFADLLKQTSLFEQLKLNELLGIIYVNGLSKDRTMAVTKLDYQILTLDEQYRRAVEQQSVVKELLTMSGERMQNYVLGIKSQAPANRPDVPLVDQGLIDSLLQNDTTSLLVREALTAGNRLKDIEARRAQVMERRKRMESFLKSNEQRQELLLKANELLTSVKSSYDELMNQIRRTHADFAAQQLGNAVRSVTQVETESVFVPSIVSAVVGGLCGATLGAALSLLGFYFGTNREPRTAS